MKKIALLVFFSLTMSLIVVAQTWEWAQRQVHYSGNTNACVWPKDVAVDGSDNILSCGYYAGEGVDEITFDGIIANGFGVGAFHYSGFVAKYNSSGTIQWVQRIGSGPTNGGVQVKGITSDASGNVYAVGYFERTTRFGGLLNSDSGGETKTSVYGKDGFIAKYNSTGIFQWVKVIAADAVIQGSTSVEGIRVTNNAIYVVGTYDDKILFGGGISLTSKMDGSFYYNDIFVAKYDLSGDCTWARSAGGAKTDYGYGIAIDPSENIFISGIF
ncbi:MAG: hypothetical protein PF590_04160 [Candidatus Delongbacteria bacterium]|jgi:hypothetical protein|nr:hypothetical protein [Candidatus Delongbacteria bacterium]